MADTPNADTPDPATPTSDAPPETPRAARRVPRLLDLSTPRAPGEAPPEPPAEPVPVPRGPAPVVGETLDLSTGRAPSGTHVPKSSKTGGLRIVVQQTINLSTRKPEPSAEAKPATDSRDRGRGSAPHDGRTRDRKGGGPRRGGDAPTGPRTRRGGSHGGGPHGGGRRDAERPKPSGTGLADFLDPETLKRLRGE